MKTFYFKKYEQVKEFLQALDEVNENDFIVNCSSTCECTDMTYVISSEEDGYWVHVTLNKNADELDMHIVDDIALKIITKI